MPTKSRLVISTVLLIDVSFGSSSYMGFFDRIFFLTWSMCPFNVDTLLGRHLITSWTVSHVHDRKYTFLIALIHVDSTGLNAAACRYLTRSV